MYQMTLFFKKVIYEYNNYLITHQKISNCTIFFFNSWGSMPPDPLAKGMASLSCDYVQRIVLTHSNLHFRKKILTPYKILYTLTLLTYMYK